MQSDERDRKVRELYDDGLRGKDIAAQVGIAEATMWKIARRLKLAPRHGPSVTIDGPQNLAALIRYASKWGRVDFDEADLPHDGSGWIAYIGDKPGYACGTQIAALRSAVAFREKLW